MCESSKKMWNFFELCQRQTTSKCTHRQFLSKESFLISCKRKRKRKTFLLLGVEGGRWNIHWLLWKSLHKFQFNLVSWKSNETDSASFPCPIVAFCRNVVNCHPSSKGHIKAVKSKLYLSPVNFGVWQHQATPGRLAASWKFFWVRFIASYRVVKKTDNSIDNWSNCLP